MSTTAGRVLITGATSDLGSEIARRLAPAYSLVLHGRDSASLHGLRAQLDGDHSVWLCDFQQESNIAGALTDFLATSSLRVSYFVHCSAKFQVAPISNSNANFTRECFQVGVFSATAIIRAMLQKKTNDSALEGIVFLSSIAADYGAKGYAVYSATKGALDSLRRSLAVELAPKVRVNAVSPGGIKTKATDFLFNDPASAQGYPLGPGAPADVAEAVEFLLSERSRWITGQSIVVDGGKSAH